MATSGGPRLEGIGRSSSNLVLCLDAHDAASYPGEPATNRLTVTSDYLPNAWGTTSHSAYASVNMRTPVGNKAHKLTLDKDGSNGYYGSPNPCRLTSSSWSNNGLDHYYSIWITTDDWSALDNSTYKYVTGSNGWPNFSATSYKCIAGGREWRLYKGFISNASNTGSGTEYYTFFKNGTYSQDLIFYIAGTMVHQNGNYAVPVASGTRSATDAFKDLSKSGNDGTFVNDVKTGVDHARDENVIFPVENCYLDFDGTDDYISIPDDSTLDITGDMTVSCWVALDSSENGNLCLLVNKRDASDTASPFYIFFEDRSSQNKFGVLLGGGSPNYVVAGSNDNFDGVYGKWDHVCFTVSGTTVSLYINGVFDASGTFTGSRQTNNVPLRLGGQYTNGSNNYMMAGQMADVKIYNKALSAAEIKSNYNQFKGRFGL